MTIAKTLAAALGVATLCGCGAGPVPNAHIATATGAVRAAEEAGADNNPTAALEVRLAREEMRSAQQFIHEGENDRAEMMLRRAESDAELARATARADSARTEANESETQLRSLQMQQTQAPQAPVH